jgi:hypothetical protein
VDFNGDRGKFVTTYTTEDLVQVFFHFGEVHDGEFEVRNGDDAVEAFTERGQDSESKDLIRL